MSFVSPPDLDLFRPAIHYLAFGKPYLKFDSLLDSLEDWDNARSEDGPPDLAACWTQAVDCFVCGIRVGTLLHNPDIGGWELETVDFAFIGDICEPGECNPGETPWELPDALAEIRSTLAITSLQGIILNCPYDLVRYCPNSVCKVYEEGTEFVATDLAGETCPQCGSVLVADP